MTSKTKRDIFFVGAARAAIGAFGGALKDVPLTQLATETVRAALQRSGAEPATVGHLVMGNVIPTDVRDAYLSRVAAVNAGVPQETPAMNVNRLCGSGLQAIVSAAQTLMLGDCDVAIGAGAESMSRAPYLMPSARWGGRMGDMTATDYMLGVLHDPFHRIHMGITAENVATRDGITREMQDQLAWESQQRAGRAIAEGRFKSQIVPIELPVRSGTISFEVDEHVRPEVTLDQLAKMKPSFRRDSSGTVTAGNSSGINDGAAALVMASEDGVRRGNLKPLARLVSYAHAALDPKIMGLGPVPASRLALKRAGLASRDLDVIESNEAFAAQACAVTRALGLDPAKVNPNGSGISLGHPVGATGVVITIKAIYELHRVSGRYALVTMCIGGGQGIAAVLERT
ncbi:acetyl-CoA C-acyltransferase family protein [Variovorax ureilyticus]|uniref:Acetyl-CoA C-acyltransferase family protein n=1 Tax=Variovorax ureilyticus TaxID=1836198 RepID=A0ABU8VM99_9BURK